MKFQPLFRVCLIFYIRFCELQKASGITPWKKCYSLLRWPRLRDVLTRRLLFKTTGSSSTKGNHHPSFSAGIGQKKTVDAAKICGGAENVVKTENPANIRKWIARFYYFRHLYSAGSACVLLTIIAGLSCPSIWATLSALLINILQVPSSCFCIVISPLWGWNNPVQRCLEVEEAALSTPEAVVASTHWLTDCFDVQPTTTSGNIITQSIIFSFSIS